MAAAGLFFVILGAGQWINGSGWGKYALLLGMVWWLFVLYQWFRDAVTESEGGQYGRKIDISYRWSMSWFIFSEVMFFRCLLYSTLVGPFALCASPGQLGQRPFVA